jgi:pyruvate formate lyase activating enzyme
VEDALFYKNLDNGRVECYLCPHYCKLKTGQTGFCRVRKNVDGKLKSLVYGKPYAVNVDPIEKKPLYHFLPGSKILSIGTAGCNLACKYCQNCDLSATQFQEARSIDLSPGRVVQMAVHYESEGIAYTYNEPTIFAEYAMDSAALGREQNLKNVMVTNGYINPEAMDQVYQNMDAANVDLKAFNEKFYTRYTLSHLQPVLDCLKRLKELGKWIEITTLIIPGYNDDETEMTRLFEWIITELSPLVPLHLTAFHPDYQFSQVPATMPSELLKFHKRARETGLKYVYVGNVGQNEASDTYCHNCSALLIKRSWYHTSFENFKNGRCSQCSTPIPGIFG